MRSDVEQNQKGNSLRNIRAGVWLVALTLLILCVVAIRLTRREAEWPREKMAPDSRHPAQQDSKVRPRPSAGQPDRKHSRAAFTHQVRPQPPLALTAEEAKRLARSAANEKARELYDCEPFWNGPSARLVDGHWTWTDRQARGGADIEATVDLEADGSMRNVDVMLLDNRVWFRQRFR